MWNLLSFLIKNLPLGLKAFDILMAKPAFHRIFIYYWSDFYGDKMVCFIFIAHIFTILFSVQFFTFQQFRLWENPVFQVSSFNTPFTLHHLRLLNYSTTSCFTDISFTLSENRQLVPHPCIQKDEKQQRKIEVNQRI